MLSWWKWTLLSSVSDLSFAKVILFSISNPTFVGKLADMTVENTDQYHGWSNVRHAASCSLFIRKREWAGKFRARYQRRCVQHGRDRTLVLACSQSHLSSLAGRKLKLLDRSWCICRKCIWRNALEWGLNSVNNFKWNKRRINQIRSLPYSIRWLLLWRLICVKLL